jgi:hypothetical protein
VSAVAAAAACSSCPGCPVPDTFCAAATPAQHQPPPPARITGFARSPQVRALPAAATVLPHSPAAYASAAAATTRSSCPREPAPSTPYVATASPCPLLRPPPDTCAAAAAVSLPLSPPPLPTVRAPTIPPSVRPTLPPPPLPWLHQSHDRADTSHCHQPRFQVRPPLTKLSAELSLPPEGDFAPFFFFLIRPHPRRELRLINLHY